MTPSLDGFNPKEQPECEPPARVTEAVTCDECDTVGGKYVALCYKHTHMVRQFPVALEALERLSRLQKKTNTTGFVGAVVREISAFAYSTLYDMGEVKGDK